MSKKVLKHISRKYQKVKQGVDKTMGGKVLDYEAKDILNRGKAIGEAIGKSEGIEIGKSEGIEIGKSEGIEIGKSEGIEIGRAEVLISKIQAKLTKGKSIKEIADALEETEESIEHLIEKYNIQKQ